MTKQPKISVVVPIYNVEKYLRQCLDSIVAQTFEDMEIILVNDGSTDGSPAIIEEFREKDGRIKVINKQNEGLGKTYNRGIDAAAGEYVGFVEPDDWIEPDMYETLYNIAKKHDVDVAKSRFFNLDDKTGSSTYVRKAMLPEDYADRVFNPRRQLSARFFAGAVAHWTAIYKRNFLHDNDIRFLETPGASFQDLGFNFKVWAMADKAYLTMKPLIHYRLGHATQSVQSKDKVFCVCDEYAEIERYMRQKAPRRFQELEKVYNLIKWNNYRWEYYRLSISNRKIFHRRVLEEFAPILKRRAFDYSAMTRKDMLRIWQFAYLNSFWIDITDSLWKILEGLITIAKLPLKHKGIEE